ncbi:Gfo/Idh/MocA family oxidoreductase [Candidatus Poribacteria bacterium]|nr:Gfo/Idh/MocA family oxidoreductase [Candidatus Poribacteria bacterium]
MDKIRVGIIGCGGIFRNLHSPYYQEPTRRADIVAIADINETSANEQADKFGAKVYTDYRELLDQDDIDAVDVCVHPRPHLEITRAAADAGKHILMEKPMCCSVSEGRQMVAVTDEADVILMVAYMMRFDPGYMKLKSLLEDGTLGTLQMAYSNQVGWFSPEKHPWLFVKEESGGMLVEQAIHNLDLWLWLFGPATSVYGYTSHVPLGGTYPTEDKAVENNAVLTVHFKNGGVGMMIKSWAAEITNSGNGLVTSNGSATMIRHGVRWKTHKMSKPEEFTASVPDDNTYRNMNDEQRNQRYWSVASKGASIDHWLKCILGDEEPTTHGQIGTDGIELAEATYLSSQKGELITLPLA